MSLVALDLPTPAEMRGRWAAFAAICATRGWGSSCFAGPGRWHYDDGGGNWADLHPVGDRAVLIGNDHEYSDTYFRTAAEYFGEPETDLLAGAPDWWAPPAEAAMAAGEWVGFVYGFDGGWSRAPYEKSDGFTSVGLPALSDDACRDLVIEFCENEVDGDVSPAAVAALLAADGRITEAMIRAVADVPGWDPAAGVAAAAAFRAY